MAATTIARAELRRCWRDPVRFNRTILNRGAYWARQAEIARSVQRYPVTLCQTGNLTGKSFCAAGMILHFLVTHPGCRVVVTAPSLTQLESVLWAEVERAYRDSLVPLGGRALKSPLTIELAPNWKAIGYSTTRTERLSGHHARHLFVVCDEASGIEPEIYEALTSLNPSRTLLIGNPLRPDGTFYERCTHAESSPSDLVNHIKIASTESPDIGMARSERGLADASFLAQSELDFGRGSIWWKCHVDGEFPDSAADSVIPRDWLDKAEQAGHAPGGLRWIAVDLSEGGGNDRFVILCRDSNGILEMWSSPTGSFESVADRVALMATKHGVPPAQIVFDVSGVGADFANRLCAVGLTAARPYRGSKAGGPKFANLRTACAWRLRQRLDPRHQATAPDGRPHRRPPFSIPREYMALLRPELQGLRYTNEAAGIALEPKAELAKRLRRSPDHGDALAMSFLFGE